LRHKKKGGIEGIFDAWAYDCAKNLYLLLLIHVLIVKPCFVSLKFALVISFCMAHFRDRIGRIPRYVYGSFCERTGSYCCLCNRLYL
jgi:hypothetical protein